MVRRPRRPARRRQVRTQVTHRASRAGEAGLPAAAHSPAVRGVRSIWQPGSTFRPGSKQLEFGSRHRDGMPDVAPARRDNLRASWRAIPARWDVAASDGRDDTRPSRRGRPDAAKRILEGHASAWPLNRTRPSDGRGETRPSRARPPGRKLPRLPGLAGLGLFFQIGFHSKATPRRGRRRRPFLFPRWGPGAPRSHRVAACRITGCGRAAQHPS